MVLFPGDLRAVGMAQLEYTLESTNSETGSRYQKLGGDEYGHALLHSDILLHTDVFLCVICKIV